MKMNEYEFSLTYRLPFDESGEKFINSLYDNGCDDAIVSVGNRGFVRLDFTRESTDAFHAIQSAHFNVKTAIPDAVFDKAGPYLLNLTELAFELGFTKQNIQKYAKGGSKKRVLFPSPVLTGKISYWYATDVFEWFWGAGIGEIQDKDLECLFAIKSLNLAMEEKKCPSMTESFSKMVASG